MRNATLKNRFRTALLAVLACALPALAGPDNVGLGTGRNGAGTVTAANQPINRYAQVTAPLAPGDSAVLVANATGFAAGDLVMVIQMTGLVPEPSSGTAGPIDLSDNPVGRWEFARLASVSGTTLNLTAPLIYSYAGNVTQLVRVPEYTTLSINAPLSPPAWNGSTGGVVAFLATGTVSNISGIVATGRGFRGGMSVVDDSGGTGCAGLDEPAPKGAQKGEGVAFTRYNPTPSTGRGRVASGGGGGVCLRAGGGGGGGAGAGGQGGNSDLNELGAPESGNRQVGGEGGTALTLTDAAMFDHLVMGGGGGAGHSTDGTARPGGAGGGIIFFRANQLSGPGVIAASGEVPPDSNETGGAGGGGAGGTIYMRLAVTTATTPPCSAPTAAGGRGGNTNASTTVLGPGGGGGGGRILLQRAGASCLATTTFSGNPGGQPNGAFPAAYGATAGTAGKALVLNSAFPVLAAPVVTSPVNGSATSDTTPTYSGTIAGTLPAGTVVAIYVDGVQVGTATPAAGSWSFTSTVELSAGPHSVYAVAINSAQAVQSMPSATHTFTVDLTPPTAPVVVTPANGSFTNDATPEYTGTTEAGTTVTVYVDGAPVGTAVVTGTGWSFTQPTDLSAGQHTVRVEAADAAGNTATSTTHTFTVDLTPPTAPVVVTPANGATLNDATPEYTGTTEAGTRVRVFVNGVDVGEATVTGTGWSFTQPADLSEGSHTVRVVAADPAGNTATSATHTFTVDLTAPAAPVVVTPANGSFTNDTTPTYTGTTEAGTTVRVFVDGVDVGEATVMGTGWSFTQPSELGAGQHTVRVVATDPAGNTATSETHTFTVDLTAPTAPVVVTPADNSFTNDTTPTYTGTTEAGTTVRVFVDGVEVGTATVTGTNWTFTQPTDLLAGQHTVRVVATDAAGNTATSTTHTFTVDLTAPPAPVVVTPEDGDILSDNTPTFSGTAEPGSTVNVIVDGVSLGTTTADAGGNWSFTPTAGLSAGQHTVSVTATDAAGNTSAPSNTHTFTVDVEAPEPPEVVTPTNNSFTNDTTPTFTGRSEANVTVILYLGSIELGTTTADAGGNWSFTPTTALMPGTYDVSAVAVDASGNTSERSNTNRFTIDVTPPAAPVITSPGDGSTTGDTTPTITGTAEPGSTVTVIIDGVEVGTTTAGDDGGWTFTPTTPLAEGPHTVSARATDVAGNTGPTSEPNDFTVDVGVPSTPVITSPANNSATNDTTPTFTGTAEPGSTVTIILDGVPVGTTTADGNGNWTFTPTTPLANDTYTLTVTARDAAGNTSAPSTPVAFTVDTVAPETEIASGPSGNTTDPNATFDFDSNEDGVTYECSLDGAAYAPCADPSTFAGLAEGGHVLRVRAKDRAGNVDPSPASATWNVQPATEGGDDRNFLGGGVGCAATGGSPSALAMMGLAVLSALLARRRRSQP